MTGWPVSTTFVNAPDHRRSRNNSPVASPTPQISVPATSLVQLTEVRSCPESMGVGLDQAVPFHTETFPVASTATQKADVVHEIPLRRFVPSMSVGLAQLPLVSRRA